MGKKVTTSGTPRARRATNKSAAFSVLRSSNAKKVVRDTVTFYRQFTRRPDVRGILEDLSKS